MLRAMIRHSYWEGPCLALVVAGCHSPDLEVAPDVELGKVEGKWHEIAHFSRSTQRDCRGTIATYTRQSDGSMRLVHECTLANGTYHGSTATAKVDDLKTPAKLSVDFGGYRGAYWIIDVGTDYRYMVVGHPSRDYLWLLSRDPSMKQEDLDVALQHARDKGFDTQRLEYTPTGPAPQGTPAPEAAYGCSTAGSTGLGGVWLGLGLGAVLVSRRGRRRRLPATP